MKTPRDIFLIVLGATLCVGWVMNVVDVVLIATGSDPAVTPLFIAKCVGIFAVPLGAVLGIFV